MEALWGEMVENASDYSISWKTVSVKMGKGGKKKGSTRGGG